MVWYLSPHHIFPQETQYLTVEEYNVKCTSLIFISSSNAVRLWTSGHNRICQDDWQIRQDDWMHSTGFDNCMRHASIMITGLVSMIYEWYHCIDSG